MNTVSRNKGTIEESWQGIEAINRSMHDAANAQEWQEVVTFAASRHQRLLAHFEHFPVGPRYAEFYQHRLTDMLDGERQLQSLARDARKRVMSESTATAKTRRALGAYLAS